MPKKKTPKAVASVPRLNCVDMSMWGGPLTADEAAQLYALGIRNIKVGVGWAGPGGAGEWSGQQARSWQSLPYDDVTVDAYIYHYMAGSAAQQVNTAMVTLHGVQVRYWWPDAEDVDSPALSPSDRAQFLWESIRTVEERGESVGGIYTGRWWWIPRMGDTAQFAERGYGLWNSYYDGDPDTDGLPYGGWTDSLVEQYQGTTILAGQSVDLNYDKTLDALPEEVDEVTRAEYEDLLLGLFSGGEETYTALEAKHELGDQSRAGELRPREQRLERAKYRLGLIVDGSAYSLSERIAADFDAVGPGLTRADVDAVIKERFAGARISIPEGVA